MKILSTNFSFALHGVLFFVLISIMSNISNVIGVYFGNYSDLLWGGSIIIVIFSELYMIVIFSYLLKYKKYVYAMINVLLVVTSTCLVVSLYKHDEEIKDFMYTIKLSMNERFYKSCIDSGKSFGGGDVFAICENVDMELNRVTSLLILYDSSDQILVESKNRSTEWNRVARESKTLLSEQSFYARKLLGHFYKVVLY